MNTDEGRAVTRTDWTPACMTAAELAAWRESNRRIRGTRPTTRPCADCLPEFRRAMLEVGSCNGFPRAASVSDDRRRRNLEAARRYRARRRAMVPA